MKKTILIVVLLITGNALFAQQWGAVSLTNPDPIPDPLKKDGTEYWFTYTYDDLSNENEDAANATLAVSKGIVNIIEGPYYNGSLFQFKLTFDGADEIEFSVTAENALGHNQGTWHSGNLALPVELTSFLANGKGEGFELQWETASELNNDYFGVQRSFDGKNFKQIGIIKGAGDSNEPTSYSFFDKEVLHDAMGSTVYYRLSQTDFDKTTTFSQIIAKKIPKTNSLNIISIRQNHNELTVDFSTGNASDLVCSLVNISGKIVTTGKIKPLKGRNTLSLPANSLPHGLYFINLTNRHMSTSKKFIHTVF